MMKLTVYQTFYVKAGKQFACTVQILLGLIHEMQNSHEEQIKSEVFMKKRKKLP